MPKAWVSPVELAQTAFRATEVVAAKTMLADLRPSTVVTAASTIAMQLRSVAGMRHRRILTVQSMSVAGE